MVAQIMLSGGPLGGTVFPVENPTADNNGVGGTVLALSTEKAVINDAGEAVVVEEPCTYRVTSIGTKRIGGVTFYSGMAVYAG